MSITTKNFNTKLSAVITSTKKMRENVQSLIGFGLEQYRDHGNASYLSSILNKCIGVKALPTVTLKDYIRDHANVNWTTLKDKTKGFKKNGKDVEVTMPTVVWYEWEGGKHNDVKTDLDVMARIKSLHTQLSKALAGNEGKKIKEGQEDKAVELERALSAMMKP